MDFEMSEEGRKMNGKKSTQHGAKRSGDALSGCWSPTTKDQPYDREKGMFL